MNRVVAWSLAFCLCCCAEQVSAQGLLGKPYVSVQYLALNLGDDFDGLDTSLGNGGRIQGNFPVVVSDTEASWSSGVDVFGAFTGIGFEVSDPTGPSDLEMNATLLGGDIGLNFHARATENIRPFVQLGMNWTQSDLRATAPGFSASDKNSDAYLILTGGVEVDVFSMLAVRASYGRGADGLGTTGFLGELIARPGENWFGRFSVSVDKDSNVISGIGAGYAW